MIASGSTYSTFSPASWRRQHVALAVRPALVVTHEAVGEHALVGRAAEHGAADQQRAVEPPAVLVGALEVEVGRQPPTRLVAAQVGPERRAGLEPHVEDAAVLVEGIAAASRAADSRAARSSARLAPVPGVGAFAPDDLGDVLDQCRRRACTSATRACSAARGSARPTRAGARCTSPGGRRACRGCDRDPRRESSRSAAARRRGRGRPRWRRSRTARAARRVLPSSRGHRLHRAR